MNAYITIVLKILAILPLLHSCNQIHPSNLHIVNGSPLTTEFAIDESSRLVALLDEDNKVFCSGILITNNHLLSAAHCVDHRNTKTIRAATWNLEKKKFSDFSHIKRTFFIQPNIKSDEFPNFDLAILELSVALANFTQPLKIADSLAIGTEAFIAGFGLIATNCDDKSKDCVGYPKITKVHLTESIQNSRFQNLVNVQGQNTGPCMGDSGGPVFKKISGGIELIGITSGVWHIFNAPAMAQPEFVCESGNALISSVINVKDWIKMVVNGQVPQKDNKKPPIKGSDFAEWCLYDNFNDPAWRTTQSIMYLISTYAVEQNFTAKQIFSDCYLAQSLAQQWIHETGTLEFDRTSKGVNAALPIASLRPKKLGFYFNQIDTMDFRSLDSVEELIIEASSIDQQSICNIALMPRLRVLELSYLKNLVKTSCLRKSTSLETLIVNGEPITLIRDE